MRIGVLGTGTVGQTLGTGLMRAGHEVRMGSRQAGNEKAVAWVAEAGDRASEGDYAGAAEFGEVVLNATSGAASLDALDAAGADRLDGKVLIDVANPLDFSKGMPPTLTVANDDSLAEQIQRRFGAARVVKTLNTVTAAVMIDPGALPEPHTMFLSGNDKDAKAQAAGLLADLGWPPGDILDLGDLTAARGQEMYLPLWLRLYGAAGSPMLNIRVVRG